MSAVLAEPPVVIARRCAIEEVFTRPFIELIRLAPRNPVVRGLILAQTRKLPGPDCVTFEQIQEWVETHCDKPMRPPNAPRTPTGDGISVSVDFSETEYGRADYSVRRYSTEELALDEDELVEMVQEAIEDGAGIDAVVNRIAREIEDDAWNRCDPSMDDYGDYDYGDHDSNETSDGRVEFSKTEVRDRLVTFLHQQHPDLLEDLT